MTYIPDCRNDESYNEDFLTRIDKEFVAGYDWCTEMAVDSFFNNTEVYFDRDSHLMHILNEKLPEDMQKEETIEWTFGNKPAETRKIETYGDLLRSKLLDWIENERDNLITSMIDNMYDDILESIRNRVLKENETTNKKDYRDTRKFS